MLVAMRVSQFNYYCSSIVGQNGSHQRGRTQTYTRGPAKVLRGLPV